MTALVIAQLSWPEAFVYAVAIVIVGCVLMAVLGRFR